jgi:predicted ester cyclase
MPADFEVSLASYVRGGTDRFLAAPPEGGRQAMRGFEPHYVDIVDYIVRITHRIWEERDIGYIYDTYRHNCRVTDDAGLQYGRDKIVADTLHTVAAFPDVRLYADEVVWAGDEEHGFHTSHRTVIIGHNTGYSRFGPPTGRKIVVWCIANCLSQENEIYEEWVIYNQSSMIRQLGLDLVETARLFGNRRLEAGLSAPDGEPTRLPGQGKPPQPVQGGAFDVEQFLLQTFELPWNRRMFGTLRASHDERVVFRGPSDRELKGLGPYQAFLIQLLAMFPDLALQVDEIYWMGNEAEGFLTSTRWSAVATHRGHGPYGPPTGRRVRLWGITQHRIVRGRIREEWMMFNEFDLLQQIHADAPIL